MSRLLLAALLSSLVVLPVAGQERTSERPRAARQQSSVVPSAPIEEQSGAEGLPGVSLDASATTEGPGGPGGLQNGVGGRGTLMPNSSSSNGQLLDDGGNGIGFPLENLGASAQ